MQYWRTKGGNEVIPLYQLQQHLRWYDVLTLRRHEPKQRVCNIAHALIAQEKRQSVTPISFPSTQVECIHLFTLEYFAGILGAGTCVYGGPRSYKKGHRLCLCKPQGALNPFTTVFSQGRELPRSDDRTKETKCATVLRTGKVSQSRYLIVASPWSRKQIVRGSQIKVVRVICTVSGPAVLGFK